MALTIQQLRDYVRVYLDTDEEEVPNALLDIWTSQAQSRVRQALGSSFTLNISASFSTSAGVSEYSWATITGDPLVAISEILFVEGPSWVLQPVSHQAATAGFASSGGQAEPRLFSQFGESLQLFPTPGDTYAMTVRAQRLPLIRTGAGETPDFPDDFHELIAEYMLARAYEQADDEIMSQQKFERFERELETLRKYFTRAGRASTRTLNYQAVQARSDSDSAMHPL